MKTGKKSDVIIILFSVIGSIWVWNVKQNIFGDISVAVFLFAAVLSVLDYCKR